MAGSSLSAGGDATYFPPPDAAGGWQAPGDDREAFEASGVDRGKLDEAFEYVQRSTKNGGLLVVRKGWLAYERYFGKGHREMTPNLASCGKSFTSIAVGMLMAERPEMFPEVLDQRVFTPAYFPAEMFPLTDPSKAEIRLGQLLSFTAGIRGNNPGYVGGREVVLDPVGPDGWQAMVDGIAMGREDGETRGVPFSTGTLWCEPGGGYSYATSSIHLASVMLRHLSGMEMEAYLAARLAEPLGWGRWGFGYRNTGAEAHTPGGGGIALRATDMLRFGYLLLRGGRWADRQVVPAEYVAHCRTLSPYNPHYPYSLQFTVNAGGYDPELPRDAFWKAGSGGHAIYVVPSLDLVVWKLGGRDDQYNPSNTGLPVVPTAEREIAPREGWTAEVDDRTALRRTLKLVVDAVRG